MEYIESGYIEAGYFETSIVGIQGEAALVASCAITAELLDISDGGNDYLDTTYVNPGYFEYVAPAAAFIEGAGALFHYAQIVCAAGKITDTQSTQNIGTAIVAVATRNRETFLYAFPNAQMSVSGDRIRSVSEAFNSNFTQSSIAGKLILGQAGVVSNDYVDSDYIVSLYFAGVLTGGLISAFTQTAVVGKIQQGVIGNLTNDYVNNTYIEGGYFFGVSDVILTATLVGDLDLVETGFIEGSALISSSFTQTSTTLRIRELVNVIDIQSLFNNIDTPLATATKILSYDSNISSNFSSASAAQRLRGIEAAFVEQTNLTTINSRIRGNASNMSCEFQTTTFGQRGRGIDLYAFTNGALVAQGNVVRDSNTLANTFFNIGTDFIRQRDNYADADAETSSSTTPIRIRDTNIETQDAFSFASTAAATRRISHSFVASFESENVFALTRGGESHLIVACQLDVIPNVTRDFDSQVSISTTTDAIPSITRDNISNQSAVFTQVSMINAIFGIDLVAFDDAEVIALVGVRKRFASDLFMVPGATLTLQITRIKPLQSALESNSSSEATAIRIHPFVANTFESISGLTAFGGRIRDLDQSLRMRNELTSMEIFPVVLFNILPVSFSVQVADEPLANTFTSRTRETGVNI